MQDMGEPDSMPPELIPPGPPRVLEYAAPPPRRSASGAAALFIAGIFLAALSVAAMGVFGFVLAYDRQDSARNTTLVFAGVAVVTLLRLIFVIRAGKRAQKQRWFILGILTGLCVGAMIEGACFSQG